MVTIGCTRIERAHQDGLGSRCSEFAEQCLRCLFDETRSFLRRARPTVMHRQIPSDELGECGIMEFPGASEMDQEILTSEFLHQPGVEPAEDLNLEFAENLGDAQQPGCRGCVDDGRFQNKCGYAGSRNRFPSSPQCPRHTAFRKPASCLATPASRNPGGALSTCRASQLSASSRLWKIRNRSVLRDQ